MAQYAYGVVVEKYAAYFDVWHLFRSAESGVTSLDARLCCDQLRVGDIVQAKTNDAETRILRYWPYTDSVWYDGTKLVIRTIVSYSREVTVDSGRWKDESTGADCVMLLSRDIGFVAAPVEWFNREFSDTGEFHHFVYAEYLPRPFVSQQTGEKSVYSWTVIEDRISLPAIPSKTEDPKKFLAPDELRRVPALTVYKLGESMLLWSYALGDKVSIILDDDKSSEIGEWRTVTIIPSSEHDLAMHSCAYTILRHEPATPYSQPEITIDNGRITMTLNLSRIESDGGGVRLWHDYWGLDVGYDDAQAEWIRGGENGQLRAIVEVSMKDPDEEADGQRVAIKAVGPAVSPRASPPLDHSSTVSLAFDDLTALKSALSTAEWAEPESNNNNNDERCADQTTTDTTEKSGAEKWKQAVGDKESEKETIVFSSPTPQQASPKWNEAPKKEMKSASKTLSTKGGLDWKNWGKEEEEVPRRETRQYERGGWNDGATLGGLAQTGTTGAAWSNPLKEETKSGKEGWVDPVKPKPKPASEFASESTVGPVPIRAFEDKATERKWRAEMTKKGWNFPRDVGPIRYADPDDEWGERMWSAREGQIGFDPPPAPKLPMPVEHFLNNRTICRDAMKLKTYQCLITKVRYVPGWREADRIQLFVFGGVGATAPDPGYVVHRIDGRSYIANLPEYTTVGNVVHVYVGRNADGYYVHDEMWRFVSKMELPMRTVENVQARVRSLKLIVSAKCLSPWEQDQNNGRHRYNQRGFTMLTHENIQNILYYGRDIDANEHEDYNFQVVVEPEECLENNGFWKATEVLWRVKKELPATDFGPAETPAPTLEERRNRPSMPAVFVEFKPSANYIDIYGLYATSNNIPVTVTRESRMDELLSLYKRMVENDALMQSLHARTGTDYKMKLRGLIEVAESSKPHQKSMKRELQVNADFLVLFVENAYTEQIFRDLGERRLWKLVVKTSDGIKAFRSTINNRCAR